MALFKVAEVLCLVEDPLLEPDNVIPTFRIGFVPMRTTFCQLLYI